MLFDDYKGYCQTYKQKYGADSTVVLMEVGSFFEIYDDGQGTCIDMAFLSGLLNINVSIRNPDSTNKGYIHMAGFPCHASRRFVEILVRNNFTVVIVSQTTPPPNPERAVTEVISPGTFECSNIFQTDSMEAGSYTLDRNAVVMVVYVEETHDLKYQRTTNVGVSICELTSARTEVCERNSTDVQWITNELQRLVIAFAPREVILACHEKMDSGMCKSLMSVLCDLASPCKVRMETYPSDLMSVVMQNEVLKKSFAHLCNNQLDVRSFLDMCHLPYAVSSLTKLLDNLYDHHPSLIKNLLQPKILRDDTRMLLSNTCAKQLNIVSADGTSLLSILDNTCTCAGRRAFRMRLLRPFCCPNKIRSCHDIVESFVEEEEQNKFVTNTRVELKNVRDIDRLARRIIIGNAKPSDVIMFFKSIKLIDAVLRATTATIPQDRLDISSALVGTGVVLSTLSEHFEESADTSNYPEGFFRGTSSASIVDLLQEQRDLQDSIQYFVTGLNMEHDNIFRHEISDKGGQHMLLCTVKRYAEFRKRVTDGAFKEHKRMQNYVRLTHTKLSELSERIVFIQSKIDALANDIFNRSITNIAPHVEQHVRSVSKAVAEIDFYACAAYNAIKFNMCRPCVVDSNKGHAGVQVKGIRHLIIEQCNRDVQFVMNDVSVGMHDDTCGILLYGMNCSGKSSLMKSIGTLVVMVQSGMYAPCKDVSIYPFDAVYTRIFTSDDIYRGHSTFAREMLELRTILNHATSKSLVLGDEVCNSTESASALALVCAAIAHFDRIDCPFVFATHLHELVNVKQMKKMLDDRVKVMHMSVSIDHATNSLVYDRILKAGKGPDFYGIEVCKALDLPADFLRSAMEVRDGVGRMTAVSCRRPSTKKSRYNKDVFMDLCGVCQRADATETHHIRHQSEADKDGVIDKIFHKNVKFNLLPVCDDCHNKIHNDTIQIQGFVQTSQGKVLKITAD